MVKIESFETGTYCQWAGFVNDQPVFADAEGWVNFADHQKVKAHDGLLAAELTKDNTSLITSGEDGKVVQIDAEGTSNLLHGGKGWIDKLATGYRGEVAFASGRQGGVIRADGTVKSLQLPRAIEGFCFAPKGSRLAVAHYDGVSLFWVAQEAEPQLLTWKGAHIGVTFSPNGQFVVSQMQENALHGWRLADKKHMRMSGYPTKVNSMSWSHDGKWLASSGAPAAIVWPFSAKDGPMGKAPLELGSMGQVMVTCVACHPQNDMLAIGYQNGLITAARFEDGKVVGLRGEGSGEISSINWDKTGSRLAFGTDEGETGMIDIAG